MTTIKSSTLPARFTDGAEFLYDYAEHVGEESPPELVAVRNNQRVFAEITERHQAQAAPLRTVLDRSQAPSASST